MPKSDRPRIEVERDSDGGITVYDPHTAISLSIICSHPAANGPRTLIVEASSRVRGKQVVAEPTPLKFLRNPRFPVVTYATLPEEDE